MVAKSGRELTATSNVGRAWKHPIWSSTTAVEANRIDHELLFGRVWHADAMGVTATPLTDAEFDATGAGKTDQATTINALIADLHTQYKGGILFFGPGIYYHSGIVNYPGVTIQGSGAGCTVFKLLPSTNQHCFRNRNANLASGGGEDGKCRDTFYAIRDCTIHGNMFNQAAGMWRDGINWDMSTADYFASPDTIVPMPDPRHTVERVFLYRCKRDGINVSGRGGSYFHRVIVGNPMRHGFNVNSYDNIFIGCEAAGTGADGMRFNNGTNNIHGAKLYFCGQETGFRYGPTLGQSVGDYIPDTGGGLVAATDWQYGAGLAIVGQYLRVVNFHGEVQDTWGHGVVVDSRGNRLDICCSNVGSLFARSGLGRGAFGSPNVLSDISAVYLAAGAINNAITPFTVVNQDGYPNSAGLLNHAVKAVAGSTKNLVSGVIQQGNLITSSVADAGTSNSITVTY